MQVKREAHRTPPQSRYFKRGDRVYVQCPQTRRWTLTGTVECYSHNEREFMVKVDNGGYYRRNRRFLKHMYPFHRQQCSQQKPETQQKEDENQEEKRRVRFSPGTKTTDNHIVLNKPPRRSTRIRKPPQRFGYN